MHLQKSQCMQNAFITHFIQIQTSKHLQFQSQLFQVMSSEKQTLINQLEEKKNQLKELQDKCELQSKKIKLFRKENQDLTVVVDERQQADTNLLIQSKEILANNSKLQKTIEELKEKLEIAKKNHSQQINNKNATSSNPNQFATHPKKPSAVSLRDLTVTQLTREIDLPSSQLTDEDTLQLEPFAQFKVLILNDNLLGNPTVSMICTKLINLQKLNLANNKFTSQSLEWIKELKQLKVLDIRNNNLNDESLKYISEVKSLCDLSCSKNNLTDNAACDLASLSNLTYLDVTNNQLSGESVKQLNRLEKVSHLYLMSNKLSKDGIIEIMRNMKSLQFLDVRFNVWQNEEKEEIRKAKHDKLEVFC